MNNFGDLGSFTRSCGNCDKIFEIQITEQEFITSRLAPITISATCPHCIQKRNYVLEAKGSSTSIKPL